MLSLIRRNEAIEVAVEDRRLQSVVVPEGLLAKLQLVGGKVLDDDVESQFPHHGDIRTEFHGGRAIPVRHMGAHALHREEVGVAPLDEDTLQRVRVVAGPKLREMAQCSVIRTASASRAEHHRQVRIFGLDAFQDPVQPPHVIDPQVRLFVIEICRVGIHDRTVAIPFEIGDAGIFCHQPVHDPEDEILNLRIAQVQNQLIPEIELFTVGIAQNPVPVLFVELAAGIDHLGFDPQTESDPLAFGRFDQTGNASGQFVVGLIPVSESLRVAVARVLVAEPSVVQQEHLHAEPGGIVHDRCELLFIEIEIGRFPVVKQRHPVACSILDPARAGPVVHMAACIADSCRTECEDELRGLEKFTGLEPVVGRCRVDAGENPQPIVLIHIEREPEITRPGQGPQQHRAGVLGHRLVEGNGKQRGTEHVGPGAERRVEYLLAEGQPGFGHVGLPGPVSRKFREVVAPGFDPEHRGGEFVQRYGFTFPVRDLHVALNDVFVFKGPENQFDIDRIDFVLQQNVRFGRTVRGRGAVMGNIDESQGGVAVVVRHAQCRGEVVSGAVGGKSPFARCEQAEIRCVVQCRAEIALAEAPLPVDAVDQIGGFGVDSDRGVPGRPDLECCENKQQGQ